MTRKNKTLSVAAGVLTAIAISLSGCSSDAGGGGASAKAPSLDATAIQPAGIVGKGKNGEDPALADALKLSDEDKKKVAEGKFSVGISMNTMDIDWSRLTIEGIQKTLDELGVDVVGVTDAKFKVQQQIADLENLITKKPDLIISIPTDDVATAQTYKKVAAAGIKLVFIHMPASGLSYPSEYQAVIAPDNQGNGQIAAAALSNFIPQDGVVGVVDFAVDFYTTNQRTQRVKEWFKENRPDVKIKEVGFTDTNAVGPAAANFMTANPDVKGLFVIWDSPAMQSVAALRNAGVNVPITTVDLGTEVAVEMANGGYIKAIGAQEPYNQGVAEARAAAHALIGNKVPAWVALPPVAVTPGNLLEKYKSIFHSEPPREVLDACKSSGLCGTQ